MSLGQTLPLYNDPVTGEFCAVRFSPLAFTPRYCVVENQAQMLPLYGLGQVHAGGPSGKIVYPTDMRPVTTDQCTRGAGEIYYGGSTCCIDLGDGRFSCLPISNVSVPLSQQPRPTGTVPGQMVYPPAATASATTGLGAILLIGGLGLLAGIALGKRKKAGKTELKPELKPEPKGQR